MSLAQFFSGEGFMPHGHCYFWTKGLIALHVGSDALIALAYFSIPVSLGWFVRQRRDIEFGWMFRLFAVFILACGMTHLMEIWNVWHSAYWLSGSIKLITALASVPTALLLVRLIPQALSLPSPKQLQSVNQALEEEVGTRRTAEEKLRELNAGLEARVAERTNDLKTANTELRSRVEELRRMMNELERSNQELQQFAYVASHDLKEPLRAVTNCVQLLSQHYAPQLGDRGAEYVTHAVDGSKRMQQLIDGLLSYSRLDQQGAELQPVEMATVIEQARGNLESAIGESGARITIGAMPTLKCHPGQMMQLFQNLLGNAIKFRGDESPKVSVQSEHREKEWLFSVQDNGIGFEPEFRERIFGLFQRLNSRRKYAGTGLGLAICKKIVERHQGRIWAESRPSTGTTILFSLPE